MEEGARGALRLKGLGQGVGLASLALAVPNPSPSPSPSRSRSPSPSPNASPNPSPYAGPSPSPSANLRGRGGHGGLEPREDESLRTRVPDECGAHARPQAREQSRHGARLVAGNASDRDGPSGRAAASRRLHVPWFCWPCCQLARARQTRRVSRALRRRTADGVEVVLAGAVVA